MKKFLDVLVDTTAVVGEVREDCEDGLHGPILHKLQLDRPDVGFAGTPSVKPK